MIVGIDFDNTLVEYGDLFYFAAVEDGFISKDFSRKKNDIRDFMNGTGLRNEWTALQGKVYGAMMDRAQLFPGAAECLRSLAERNIPCYIISHKTRYAKKGPAYDLHEAAREFLRKAELSIPREQIFFCPEREEKILRIRETRCTHFIDDLPEVFAEPDFPAPVRKLLFGASSVPADGIIACPDWNAVREELSSDD